MITCLYAFVAPLPMDESMVADLIQRTRSCGESSPTHRIGLIGQDGRTVYRQVVALGAAERSAVESCLGEWGFTMVTLQDGWDQVMQQGVPAADAPVPDS